MSASETKRTSPYQGLIPYGEADAPFFFGREKETRLIIANLFACPLTLLYGASGVGKSSVLRAGVAHQLRERDDLLVLVFNAWQSNPVTDLQNKIAEKAGRLDPRFVPPTDSANLSEYLVNCAGQLDRRLMIILDQFEEYFLYHPKDDGFAAEFSRAVTQSGSPVSFLISIREDFYAKLDRFEGRIPTLYDNYLRIEHLDRRAARVAIESPISEYNRHYTSNGKFSIEPDLVDAVLRQVETGRVIIGEAGRGVVETAESAEGAARIETPFLQLVMTRLWEKEQSDSSRELRLKTLKALGGAENIVRTHLDSVITKLSDREQEIAASVFHYLVTPSGTKIAYTASDLAGSAELEEAEVVGVLKRLSFGDVRILRTVEPSPDRPTSPRYEIFHDVLAPAILTWRTAYVQAQERAEAERQLASEAAQREKAVRQLEREKGLARRLRWALGGVGVLLVLMGIVTFWALQQKRAATRAEEAAVALSRILDEQKNEAIKARATAEVAKSEADKQRDAAEEAKEEAVKERTNAQRSAAAALAAQEKEEEQRKKTEIALNKTKEALEQRDLADAARRQQEAINELRTEVEQATTHLETRPTRSLTMVKGVLDALDKLDNKDPAFSKRAEEILRRAEHVLRRALIALEESNTKKVLSGHKDSVEGAYFSPNGELLVTTSAAGGARVWDSRDWHEMNNSITPSEPIRKVVFNSDGSRFLTISESGVLVWDKGSLYSPILKAEGEDATFGPDGNTVLLPDSNGDVIKWEIGRDKPISVPRPSPETVSRGPQIEQTWISPDGTLALSAGYQSGVRVWEIGKERPPLDWSDADSDGRRRTVVFSNDGKYVANIGSRQMQVMDISDWRSASLSAQATPQPEASPVPSPNAEPTPSPEPKWKPITLPLSDKSAVIRAQFNPTKSAMLLTLNADGTTLLWDITNKGSEQVLQTQTSDVINALFSPDGEFVLLLGSDGTVRIWNIAKRAIFATLRGHEEPVLSAAFNPRDGSLVTASYDKTARVWEWKPKIWRANPTIIRGRSDLVTAFFSEDGRFVLAMGHLAAGIWPLGDSDKPAAEFPGSNATFSADGRLIAIADKEPLVQLVDARKGQTRLQLNGHTGEVRYAVFSGDGKYLLTTSLDKTARVWEVATGTSVVLSGNEKAMTVAAFSADAKLVLAVAGDGTTYIWKWQTEVGRTRPSVIKITSQARIAAISPDGNFIATTAGRGDVNVWETSTGDQVTVIKKHRAQIHSVTFSPDSKRLLTVEDYGVRILKLAGAGPAMVATELVDKSRPALASALPARGAAFSADGRLVVTGGGRLVQVWDVSARTPRRVAFATIAKGRILGVAYSPRGGYIAVGVADDRKNASVHVWKAPIANSTELSLGEEAAVMGYDMPVEVGLRDHVVKLLTGVNFSSALDLAFSEDEKVIFASDNDRSSAVWDWQSDAGRKKPTFVRGRVNTLSPDGRLVFSSRQTGVIRVQETNATIPSARPVIRGIEGELRTLALRPDGGMVAAIAHRREDDGYEELLMWDSKANSRAALRLPEDDATNPMNFSSDGHFLAVANKNKLLLYSASDDSGETGRELPLNGQTIDEFGGHKGVIFDVQFSPDNKYLVTASADKTARVWDVTARKAVLLLRGHFGAVTSCSFSRDGQFIVTTSTDKTARVWKWKPPTKPGALAQLDGDPIRLEGHAGTVSTAGFDRERRFVLTGSSDNTARLWNARTGQLLAELVGHSNDVDAVQFSPDGKSILTVGTDGTAQIYACLECGGVEELLVEARARLQKQPEDQR